MQTQSVRTSNTAAVAAINTPSSKAIEADVRPTAYYPANTTLQGGFLDKRGAPLKGHTLNEYLRMSPEQQAKGYVAVAMDGKIPYGTRMRIPELEQKMNGGKPINFKVVDTGGAFQGKGLGRMDICVENEKASRNPLLNQTDRPKQGLSASMKVIFPDGLKAVKTSGTTGGTATPSTGGALKQGASGTEVKQLQEQLNKLGYSVGEADGKFGPKTEAAVKKFQADKGLESDGVVGSKTTQALKKATSAAVAPKDGFEAAGARKWTEAPSLEDVKTGGKLLKEGMQGPAVKKLQEQLGIEADGKFGPGTKKAVADFQKAAGLKPGEGNEGVVGKTTLEHIAKAATSGTGGTSSVDGISAKGRQQMQDLLDIAQRGSSGKRPDGRCLWHVNNWLDRTSYGKIGNGNSPRMPLARNYGDWLNKNHQSLGLKKLNIDNPYQAPPGAIIVVRPGTPGTRHPTAGDIVVMGKNGHMYNGGEMGYGGPRNFPKGNKHVIGIFVPQ